MGYGDLGYGEYGYGHDRKIESDVSGGIDTDTERDVSSTYREAIHVSVLATTSDNFRFTSQIEKNELLSTSIHAGVRKSVDDDISIYAPIDVFNELSYGIEPLIKKDGNIHVGLRAAVAQQTSHVEALSVNVDTRKLEAVLSLI